MEGISLVMETESPFLYAFVIPAVKFLVMIGLVFLGVAYLTYMERKIVAFIQVRLGPRRVGWHGILQPIADVVKLLLKEDLTPKAADKLVFKVAPVLCILPSFVVLALLPWGKERITLFGLLEKEIPISIAENVNVGLLLILAVSSLGIYGIILGGWSSNSRYPLLGSLRSTAQMVSYEVPLTFSVIAPLMVAGSTNIAEIMKYQEDHGWLLFAHWTTFIPMLVAFVVYFTSGIAETNRLPFDMPEAESELVAGYHTEYSGMRFALFFLAEYINMIVVSAIAVTLFLGGYHRPLPSIDSPLVNWMDLIPSTFWFLIKIILFLYVYIWIRGTWPRYRYDQLMKICWKRLLPISIAVILVTGLVLELA